MYSKKNPFQNSSSNFNINLILCVNGRPNKKLKGISIGKIVNEKVEGQILMESVVVKRD